MIAEEEVPSYKSLSKRAAIYFSKKTGHVPVQDLSSLDELYEHVDQVEEKFIKLGERLSQLTGGEFILGPTKLRDVAEEKIKTDLNNKETLISDIIRAKLVVDTPEAISDLREILCPTSDYPHEELGREGAFCAQMADYFADPKFETGYRALNTKIALPLDDDRFYLVELQVVHEAIEATYDKTHRHMREAQKIANKYRNERMPNSEAIRQAAHYAVCKYTNGCAAQRGGLDPLLSDPKAAITKEQAEDFQRTIRAYRLDY